MHSLVTMDSQITHYSMYVSPGCRSNLLLHWETGTHSFQ